MFVNCVFQQCCYIVMGIGRYQICSEDCFIFNVVIFEELVIQLLLVMVFIYGGGYILGSLVILIYDGVVLVCCGCVYVLVNYWLGVLGCFDLLFLLILQIIFDSNVYLCDLVLVLCWVYDNIVEFGGDLGNVIIFGESVGVYIIVILLVVLVVKGLFVRVILESLVVGMVCLCEVVVEFVVCFVNLIGVCIQDVVNVLMQVFFVQLVEV